MQSKITKRTVDATRPKERDSFLWDTEVKGFGLKTTPKGRKVYLLQYRLHGALRRFTIGTHGSPWTPEKARDEALRLLGKIKDGNDPSSARQAEKDAITVSKLCDLYLKEGVATKKTSTIATDKGRIERHIKPLLGQKRVKEVTSGDIKKFMREVAEGKSSADVKTKPRGRARVTGGKGTATRTVGLLGGIFSFAFENGYRSDNPVRGVKKYPDRKNERYLSPKELARLGKALTGAIADGKNELAINAIRLLILTGCRKSEILTLEWNHVNFEAGYLELPESKTGQKRIPLGAPALDLLARLKRVDGNPYVLPGEKEGHHLVGVPRVWRYVREKAGLSEVRLHDLRHSFASVGAGAGMSLAMIGKLLGHRDPKTTARYAHIADDPQKAAANQVSTEVASQMANEA